MSRIKEIIINRTNEIKKYVDRLESYEHDPDYDIIYDTWCALGLPIDINDHDFIFDIVVEDECFEETISMAEEFFTTLEKRTKS